MTDDLIKLLKPYPQPLSQPVPNRIWLHDLGGGDIAWCDDPQPVPGEDMGNVAYIRVDIMNDRIEAQEAEIARLRDLLCLADELLMEAKGAFPLQGNPLRPAYLKIREASGDDYPTRKSRARAALGEKQ